HLPGSPVSLFSSLREWGHHHRYADGMERFNRGDFEGAAECFEAALAELRDPRHPDSLLARCYAAEARAHRGLALFHSGEDARAEAEFDRSLEHQPAFPELRYYRARIRERAGRWDEAVADLKHALADRPRYAQALMLLALCFDHLNDRVGVGLALDAALAEGFPLPARLRGLEPSDWDAGHWRTLPRAGAGASTHAPDAEALERYR